MRHRCRPRLAGSEAKRLLRLPRRKLDLEQHAANEPAYAGDMTIPKFTSSRRSNNRLESSSLINSGLCNRHHVACIPHSMPHVRALCRSLPTGSSSRCLLGTICLLPVLACPRVVSGQQKYIDDAQH